MNDLNKGVWLGASCHNPHRPVHNMLCVCVRCRYEDRSISNHCITFVCCIFISKINRCPPSFTVCLKIPTGTVVFFTIDPSCVCVFAYIYLCDSVLMFPVNTIVLKALFISLFRCFLYTNWVHCLTQRGCSRCKCSCVLHYFVLVWEHGQRGPPDAGGG